MNDTPAPGRARLVPFRYLPTQAGLVATLLLSLSVTSAWGAQSESQDKAAATGHEHHQHHARTQVARKLVNYTLPPVTIVDQRGNRMSLPELLDTDQPIMVNFIFTTCTAICPMMSSIFQQVQMKLGADAARVRMISVSIDPEQDTPEALQEYAQRFRAGPEWYFITGTLEDSIAIQQAFDAYRGDKMNHAPLTLMREARGDEWVRYDGFATAEQLAEDCRRLL